MDSKIETAPQPHATPDVASKDGLPVFGKKYPIMADLKSGWYLVAHTNGPAIANSTFEILASLAHQNEDIPESVRREAVWQLMMWVARLPMWPDVSNEKLTHGGTGE